MIFVVSAASLWIASAYAFANPRVRGLETEIPDAVPDEPGEIEVVVEDQVPERVEVTPGRQVR
jgi:hypothetical protein